VSNALFPNFSAVLPTTGSKAADVDYYINFDQIDGKTDKDTKKKFLDDFFDKLKDTGNFNVLAKGVNDDGDLKYAAVSAAKVNGMRWSLRLALRMTIKIWRR
jgi:hypothetical protein